MKINQILRILLILVLGLSQVSFSIERNENQEPLCEVKPAFDFLHSIDQLSKTVGKTTLKDGFFLTPYNLKIDIDCQKRIKIIDLEKYYREAMAEGSSCLARLSASGVGTLGDETNACLLNLFKDKNNPPKIFCGGWPFGESILAVGSFPGSSKRHPYLWLSPGITDFKKGDANLNKGIMFHEMIHNCGYTHGEGLEITSTCEECCFGKGLTEDKKRHACNICAGKYKEENDSEYVKELLAWSKDYPTWGLQNRQRVLDVALKNKNRVSLALLADELPLDVSAKRELVEILLIENPSQVKVKLYQFFANHKSLLGGDKRFELLLKKFNDL